MGASRIHAQLWTAQDHLLGYRDLVDSRPFGLTELDPDHRVIWASRAAREMLEALPDVSIQDGLIQGPPRFQEELESKLRGLAESGLTVAVNIPREGQRPLALFLMGREAPADAAPRWLAGWIMVGDPDWVPVGTFESVRDLWGLTRAEASLATLIAAGQTPAEIAEKSGRSVETIRTQLKFVFRKVGVHRQPDLVRMLTIANGLGAGRGPS